MDTKAFREGFRDGIPIGLGCLAVSFSLGIFCKTGWSDSASGLVTSFLENASAGEYIAFTLISANTAYIELCLMTIIANARYLLMSCAMSQRFSPDTPMIHRFFVAFDLTDELFGRCHRSCPDTESLLQLRCVSCRTSGLVYRNRRRVIAGNLLQSDMVKALSVSLFGMFLAIIIPPARKDKVVLVLIIISFAASYLSRHPWLHFQRNAHDHPDTDHRWNRRMAFPSQTESLRKMLTHRTGGRCMSGNIYIYIAIVAITSYLIRVLPLTLIRKPIKTGLSIPSCIMYPMSHLRL